MKKESNVEVEIKSKSKPTKPVNETAKPKPKPKPKSSNSKLEKGDTLPSITLENEDGEEVDVSGLSTGGKGVVIFVYPKVCLFLFHDYSTRADVFLLSHYTFTYKST